MGGRCEEFLFFRVLRCHFLILLVARLEDLEEERGSWIRSGRGDLVRVSIGGGEEKEWTRTRLQRRPAAVATSMSRSSSSCSADHCRNRRLALTPPLRFYMMSCKCLILFGGCSFSCLGESNPRESRWFGVIIIIIILLLNGSLALDAFGARIMGHHGRNHRHSSQLFLQLGSPLCSKVLLI